MRITGTRYWFRTEYEKILASPLGLSGHFFQPVMNQELASCAVVKSRIQVSIFNFIKKRYKQWQIIYLIGFWILPV